MIDFTLSESQRQQRDGARAFAQKVLNGAHAVYSEKLDQKERFRSIRPYYRAAVAGGLIKGQVPIPMGGDCAALLDAAIVLEELYATDPSVTLTVAATGLGLTPLIMSGNEKLQRKFLEPFLKDEGEPLASLVHSEPQGTANWLEKGADGLQTTARKDGGNWIINGEKVPRPCHPERHYHKPRYHVWPLTLYRSGPLTAEDGMARAQTCNALCVVRSKPRMGSMEPLKVTPMTVPTSPRNPS